MPRKSIQVVLKKTKHMLFASNKYQWNEYVNTKEPINIQKSIKI